MMAQTPFNTCSMAPKGSETSQLVTGGMAGPDPLRALDNSLAALLRHADGPSNGMMRKAHPDCCANLRGKEQHVMTQP